jgi:hypothetical protein
MTTKRILMRIAFRAAGILAMLTASAFSLAATGMWALEPWLRPLILLHVNERWLLAAAIAGWATAAFAWPGKWRRSCWWRAGVAGVLCVGCMIAASIPAREVAMRMLMRSLPVHSAFKDDAPKWRERDAWTKHFDEHWFYFGKKSPEWKQIGENSFDGNFTSTQYRTEFTPFDHLIETSRWSFRKFFIMEVMQHERAVELATRDWHRLFPAIIGQDVTLARRNELIGLLHKLSNDPSVAPASRDAATFWMGLIVLTDAPAFEHWRLPVRDAMLASEDPPMSLTGDVWMRVLDALLAFDDDPETSVGMIIHNRSLLRRALRERVRGMEAHIPAIIEAVDVLDAHGHSGADTVIWMDLKQLLDRMPDGHDDALIHAWLREKIFKWLVEDTSVFQSRFLRKYWFESMPDLFVEFENDQLGILAAWANELVNSTDPSIRDTRGSSGFHSRLPTSIIQAIFIRNLVNDERRVILSNVIGSFLVRHFEEYADWEQFDWRTDSGAIRAITHELSGIWQDLDEDLRISITQQLKQSLVGENAMRIQTPGSRINRPRPTLPLYLLPFFDSTLEHRTLNETEHLALLAALIQGNHGALSAWAIRPDVEPLGFSPETVASFTQTLAAALDDGQSSVSFRDEPDAIKLLVPWFGALIRNFHQSELPLQDVIPILLVSRRIVGMEHLPDDWPRLFHACLQVRRLAGDHDAAEIWHQLLGTPASTLKTLETLSEESGLILIGMFSHLMRNPPDPEVRNVILDHYREMAESDSPDQRRKAWHVLMKTGEWMNPDEWSETRKRFVAFFMNDRPSLSEWSHTLMLNRDPLPGMRLMHIIFEDAHRGEWVAWEEDALSARLSWSSQIHHECSLLEHDWKIKPDGGLFAHLLNASDACSNTWGTHVSPQSIDDFHPSHRWRHAPPQIPFPPTAWQRARELHLKRPDLHFPDRPTFRPTIQSFSEKR